MYKLTAEQKRFFQEYVEACTAAVEDISFLFDHCAKDQVADIRLDHSTESIAKLEMLCWKVFDGDLTMPPGMGSSGDLAGLVCRYFSQSIIAMTSAKLKQTKEHNRRFGLPVLDGFGNKPYECIYPSLLAEHFFSLPQSNPTMPGARTRSILQSAFQHALEKNNTKHA